MCHVTKTVSLTRYQHQPQAPARWRFWRSGDDHAPEPGHFPISRFRGHQVESRVQMVGTSKGSLLGVAFERVYTVRDYGLR